MSSKRATVLEEDDEVQPWKPQAAKWAVDLEENDEVQPWKPRAASRATYTILDSEDERDAPEGAPETLTGDAGKTIIPVSDSRLFNISASTEDVLEDIRQAFPLLDPSKDPQVQQFMDSCLAGTFNPPKIPQHHINSLAPPSVNPELDAYWADCVRKEPRLQPGTYHKGLNMDPRLIVKPWETTNSVIIVMGSYPTISTTVHPHNGTIRDVSNPSIAALLAKLGYYHSGTRSKPILVVDLFPRRLDRKAFSGTFASSIEFFKKLPTTLVKYWSSVALDLWSKCSAPIGVLIGNSARLAYEDYTKANGISVEVIELPGDLETSTHRTYTKCHLRAWAYLEHQGGSISRIVFPIAHPESFSRNRAVKQSFSSRYQALQERMLDLVDIMAFGSVY